MRKYLILRNPDNLDELIVVEAPVQFGTEQSSNSLPSSLTAVNGPVYWWTLPDNQRFKVYDGPAFRRYIEIKEGVKVWLVISRVPEEPAHLGGNPFLHLKIELVRETIVEDAKERTYHKEHLERLLKHFGQDDWYLEIYEQLGCSFYVTEMSLSKAMHFADKGGL